MSKDESHVTLLCLCSGSQSKKDTPLAHSRRIAKEKRTERTTRKLDIANVQPRSSFHIIDSTDWHSLIRLKVDANSSCLLSLGSRHRKLVTVRLYFSASTPSARIQIVHAFDPLHKVVLFAPWRSFRPAALITSSKCGCYHTSPSHQTRSIPPSIHHDRNPTDRRLARHQGP